MSGTKREAIMAIGDGLGVEHVQDLANAFSKASDEFHSATGKPANGDEIIEATLCSLCEVIQQGPDEATRAMLACHAMRFILRNSNTAPFAILEAFVASTRSVEFLTPQGTA